MGKITPMVRAITYFLIIFGSSNYIFGINSSDIKSDFYNSGDVCNTLFESLDIKNITVETLITPTYKHYSEGKSIVFVKPTISLNTIPAICKGTTSAILSYSGTTQNPSEYSIVFSSAAKSQGFVDVEKTHSFSASSGSINIVVPGNAAAGTYTAQFFVSNSEKSDPYTITIKINDIPTVNKPSDQTVCNNVNTASIAFSGNNLSGVTYNWTNSKPSIGLGANGSGNILSFKALNSGSSPVKATITVTPTANGCTGTPQTFEITVNPTTSFAKPLDVIACNNEVISAINYTGASVAGTTYGWTNNNTAIGLAASGNGNISAFTAKNTGNAPISGTITVTPTANGCVGTPQTFKITVNPTANFTKPVDVVACDTDQVSAISFSGNNVSGTTYSWTNDNTTTGLAASGNGNISAFTAKNTGNAPISGTVTVTPTANGCVGIPQTFKITVNPIATVTQTSDFIVCNEDPMSEIVFSGSNVTGTTYSWTNDNTTIGLAASGNGNISAFTAKNTGNAPISGTITVTPIANECEGTPQSFKITVNPTPSINNISDIIICNGESLTKVILEGSLVSGTTYNWTNSDTSIGLSGNATGDIPTFTAINNTTDPVISTITATPIANNCKGDPISFSITVNPTPTITKPADIVVCDGETVEEIVLRGSSVNGTRRDWTNDNIAIGLGASGRNRIESFVASNTTNQSIFATITIVPTANDCEGIPETFKIEVKPRPTVIAPEDQVYCNGALTTAISLTGSPSGVLYDIKGGAAIGLSNKVGVAKIPAFTALKGTASIEITPKANGCIGDPVTYNITVNPTPTVSLTPPNQSLCSGETTNISLSGQITGTTFKWVISEISPVGSITGATDGTGVKIEQLLTNTTNAVATIKYKITPTANNCDGTPITATITVNPTPDLQITNPATVCSPAEVNLTAAEITSGSSSGVTFTYFTNDAATSSISDPTKVGAGTYYIKATSGTGCSIIKPVVVTENSTPELTSTLNPTGICGNSVFSYTPTTNTTNTTVTWIRKSISGLSNPQSSGTGNPDEILNLDPAITSSVIVTYFFTLTTPEGCENTQEVNVNVTPTPNLSNATTSYTICGGTDFSFTPQSEVSNTTFTWTRAAVAGNIAASGTGAINETLINNTTQNVGVEYIYTLRSNNCSNPQEYSVTATVLPSLEIEVSASKVEICPGESINLFSSSELNTNLPATLLSENFNGSNNWTTTFTARTGIYNSPSYNLNIASSDNSQYYLSDSGSQNGNRSLRSPSINTTGYISLSLNFDLLYLDRGDTFGDTGHIEVSTNGSNWTALIQPLNRSIGRFDNATDSYRPNTYSLNLSAYTGLPTLYVRFRHNGPVNSYVMAVDNVSVTGKGSNDAEVTWTSDVGDFTSTEQNPTNVTPLETTIYTATYTDPDTGCPNSKSVEVIVRQPPAVTITPNYCGNSTFIELVSDNVFATYQWESGGKILGTGRSVDVELAQTYTLTVTDSFGCMGIGSISVSDELLTNGDFESGPNGFYTEYTDETGVSQSLYPEGYFAVDKDANFYHNNFYGKDHTTGNGNFMIINGHPGSGKVIWRQTITNIQPNTNYYFSAWGMNLNPGNPARLQFQVNGVPTGTVADLKDAPKPTSNGQVNTNNWIQFYSNPFWNSGDATTAVLEIINLETIRSGNDFGIDDISFGTLEPIIFSIDPQNNSAICEGSILELYANIEGGRDPIEYKWTNAKGEVVSTEENPILENLLATDSGTYTLTVTDGYGCSPQIGTTEVEIIPETMVNAGEDQTVCAENATVTLNGLVSGSTATGAWAGGAGTFNPNRNALNATYTPSAEEISTGSVLLTLISDTPTTPCSIVEDDINIIITPTPIIDTIETVMPSCYQSADGSAKAIVSSGTGAYTYAWSNGQTTQTANGLGVGDYSVVITDETGCSVSQNITIIEPSPLEIIESSFTPVTCFAGEDGSVSIEVAGGILVDEQPVYIITLLDKDGLEIYTEESNTTGIMTVPNLTASTYTFTVTTPNACTSVSTALTVSQPDEIPASAGDDISIVECGTTVFNLNAAEIDLTAASGSWSITLPTDGGSGTFRDNTNRQTRFTGKANTSYTLRWTVTPANGCPAIFDELEITFPPSCSKLDFDGVDDYVDFGDNFSLRNTANTFSLEAWVKPNSINGINTIISKRNLNDLPGGGYDLILNNGKPSLRLNNKTISTTQSIGTDRWYHIAAVQDGNIISLYVDGIKLKTDNLATKPGNISAPTLIGAMYDPAEPLRPKNNFHGWIEEVRIWKTGLNQEQVRFMMNQRIKNNNGKVQGEIIPLDVPENLSWNNLEGYYRLITGEVTPNGLTLDIASSGVSGILKNIETFQQNTAPLPYISTTNGVWSNKNTWLRPDVWDYPNAKGINGDKIDWNIAKISHDISSGGQDIKVLGLFSESNELGMFNPNEGKDEKNSGQGLTVTHYLKLDGNIKLMGDSQLVQTEGSILDNSSIGYIEKDQQGTASSYNYNYWSSPVVPQGNAINSTYNVANVLMDGTNTSSPKNINFGQGVTYADGAATSPRKISNYWLFKFRGKADEYSDYEHIGSTGILNVGEGYTMKGTSGSAAISDRQNYIFKGKPNNGDITLSVGKEQNYMLGNPYPSAMDANKFILDNLNASGGTNLKNIFNGALYFWDHFGGKTHILREYIGGYATYNLIGGVKAIATDDRINSNTGAVTSNDNVPGQYIPVGQGFFINTTIDDNRGNITGDGGDVVFRNSQRAFVRENTPASHFLSQEKNTSNKKEMTTDSKIRLDFSSPLGYHRQILVGTNANATNGYDLGYDAPLNDYSEEDFFWLIDNYEYVIQGVSNFDPEQVLPIGIYISKKGEFHIEINNLENVPDETNIYLKDIETNQYFDLRESGFTMEIEPGAYYERFQIVFFNPEVDPDTNEEETPSEGTDGENEEETDGSEIPKEILDSSIEILYMSNNRELMILNPDLMPIQRVGIYNLLGQRVQSYIEITNDKEIKLPVYEYASGIYVVKLFSENSQVSKNILIKK